MLFKEAVFMFSFETETFLAIVREKTLSKAAENLHLGQTTVSQRLKLLEEKLGISLIERSKGVKEIHLTPAGEEFYRLDEQWNSLYREAMILKAQGPRLSLTVGAVSSFNRFVLSDVYRAINKHQPQIQLKLHDLHSWDIYESMEKKKIDIGFGHKQLLHPNIEVTKIFTAPMVVLRPATTTEQAVKIVHPAELDPNYEVLVYWSQEFEAWHEHWWNPLTPSRIRTDTVNLLFGLMHNPMQWTIVPLHIANAASKRGNYFVYQLTDLPPDYTCYKLTHKHSTPLTIQAMDIFNHYFDLSVGNAKVASSDFASHV